MGKSNLETAFEFRIPSKTFIVGEYLALKGGPSLVAATGPCFQVGIENGQKGEISLHPESPAGRFLNEWKPAISDFLLEDPYEAGGGFGRSTAEFLSLYLYNSAVNGDDPKKISIETMVKDYQKVSASGKLPPSGADLVAQYKGGICLYNGESFESQSLNWPWPSKSFLIFHTGRKLPTHRHLEALESFKETLLKRVAEKAISCFLNQDFFGFSQCVDAYSDELHTMGLFDTEIHEKVTQLRQYSTIDAAKGCGAMGVDTVLVLGDRQDEESIIAQGKNLGFEYISGLGDLGQGTEVHRQGPDV